MEQFQIYFSAWRTVVIGSRQVVDGLVPPHHRAPSSELRTFLKAWPGAHYWADQSAGRLVLISSVEKDEPIRWFRHIVLFALTALFSLAAGAAMAGVWAPPDYPGIVGGLGRELYDFGHGLIHGDWRLFLAGWSFAVPSLGILLVHELGHYVAARRYWIDTTPPYFIPMPPSISPIGSFGAFIRIRSPVLDRQQLADVGAAGPIAGFVVAIVVLVWGYLTSSRVTDVADTGSYVTFANHILFVGDSLLTHYLREWLVPGKEAVRLSLPAFAGWVGCFLTGLNLLPLSQLDGGHVAFGFIGKRQAIVAALTVGVLLYLSQYSSSWIIWVIMAFVIGGGRLSHPPVVIPDRPIHRRRIWVGIVCLVIFVLTFVPVPFRTR